MTPRPIQRLLVANRGEIAARVIKTARALGLDTVAVFSDADADAPYVALADEAVRLGPAAPLESYLDVDRVLEVAKSAAADAIHPGYGFLSENAGFARACEEAGVLFVGPPATAIELMGDKARSKALMKEAGVPCVPGYDDEDQSVERLSAEAATIGTPLLIKASAGGGGRGMRAVHDLNNFEEALASARREAHQAFGDDRVLLERLVTSGRHVEVQVFADTHGTTVHLGERDCSTQRRHQKVLEEAPSPAVDRELRARMGEAAVAAARAVNYVGAGTVEFLLADDGSFYFLEMNTRLQVEHPVTELVTGLDLVALQLSVAAGEPLPMSNSVEDLCGHAIEARLYVEDPYAGFMPDTGPVLSFIAPTGEGIRADVGIQTGQVLSGSYDPMVAKIIAYGATREQARRRLARAMRETVLLGPTHNAAWLTRVLDSPAFTEGRVTTDFLDSDEAAALHTRPATSDAALVAAALFHVERHRAPTRAPVGWRNAHPLDQPVVLTVDGERHTLRLGPGDARHDLGVTVGDRTYMASLDTSDAGRCLRLDGRLLSLGHVTDDAADVLNISGSTHRVEPWSAARAASGGPADGRVCSPATGTIVRVQVSTGDRVQRGDPLVIVEAMKLETAVAAPVDGVVEEVHTAPGTQAKKGALLVTLREDEAPESGT